MPSQIATGVVSEFALRPGGYGQLAILPFHPQTGKWGDELFVRCEDSSVFTWDGERIPATRAGFLDLLARLWSCREEVTFTAKPLTEFYGAAREVAFTTRPYPNQGDVNR